MGKHGVDDKYSEVSNWMTDKARYIKILLTEDTCHVKRVLLVVLLEVIVRE